MRDVKFSCMHARIYEILQFESCYASTLIPYAIWIEYDRRREASALKDHAAL